ncbi:MAG: EF-hand domain-containing protein [Alphaproteobacteria bacterium]|nr:MAG: EF-hand domain-containing protein [Alphaproteobacteria bacterium]
MRVLLLAPMLLAASWAGAQAPSGPVRGLFFSPMGEPYRTTERGKHPVDLWVAAADSDHDGALTLVEIQHDAARFFATLDTNRDGEIDPTEMERYEQDVAPELHRFQSAALPKVDRRRNRLTGDFDGSGSGSASNPLPSGKPRGIRGGMPALLNIPQPVWSADTDFNRGVNLREFEAAAGQRFVLIDANHDGLLKGDELVPGETREWP